MRYNKFKKKSHSDEQHFQGDVTMEKTLKKWTMQFAGDVAEHFRDESLTEKLYEGIPQPFEVKHARLYIEERMFRSEDRQYCRAIVDGEKAIGGIDVFLGSGAYAKTAEIIVWVASAYQNRGIGTNAVAQCCREVFEKYDIARIAAKVDADDEISGRLFTAAGFTCEGTMRCSVLRSGHLYDQKIYARIKTEE